MKFEKNVTLPRKTSAVLGVSSFDNKTKSCV